MQALILAGGLGTRLRTLVNDRPKGMAGIAGKPFLEYQIAYLKKNRIDQIVLCVGYLNDRIKAYFGDGKRGGCKNCSWRYKGRRAGQCGWSVYHFDRCGFGSGRKRHTPGKNTGRRSCDSIGAPWRSRCSSAGWWKRERRCGVTQRVPVRDCLSPGHPAMPPWHCNSLRGAARRIRSYSGV